MRLLCSLLCVGGKQDGSIGAITKTDEAAKIWIFLFFKKKIKGKWKHLFLWTAAAIYRCCRLGCLWIFSFNILTVDRRICASCGFKWMPSFMRHVPLLNLITPFISNQILLKCTWIDSSWRVLSDIFWVRVDAMNQSLVKPTKSEKRRCQILESSAPISLSNLNTSKT